jgi:hypothetical protein
VPKLNQIIAVESGLKTSAQKELTEAHHALQKPALLSGLSRKYQPKDDDGQHFPDENTRVQMSATEMIQASARIWTKLFDVTFTKDMGNSFACADVIVDGKVLVPKAPVPFLLFLEKRLLDVEAFIRKIPTLDPAESWTFDMASNCYASTVSETVKTVKVPKSHIVVPATKEHPAQAGMYNEDVVVGLWRTVKYSGALPGSVQADIIARVVQLREAVKMAREEANSAEVVHQRVGADIFKFLLGTPSK